jgi:HEAT repeat protein
MIGRNLEEALENVVGAGVRQVVPGLVRCLKDSDWMVKQDAGFALREIDPVEAATKGIK